MFLNIELERGRRNEKIRMKWFQNKENAGIYCTWRGDVDESMKRNIVRNMERKIRKKTTKEIRRN